MNVPDPTRTLLDWHQSRRAAGIPTVTALAGPVNLAVRAWRGWAGPRHVCVARVDPDLDALGVAWATDTLAVSSTLDHARAWLAGVANRDVEAIIHDTDRATRYDLDSLWRSLPLDPTGPTPRLAFLILAGHASGTPLDPARVVRDLSAETAFRGLCGLVPEDRWPALLVVPAMNEGWLNRAAAALERIATAVPGLPVAVSASRAECEAAAPEHVAAVVREGLIVVEGLTAGELDARLQAAGVAPPPATATLTRLIADGLDDDAATLFVEAARSVRNPPPVEPEFRSEAERFLFDQLEAMPTTAGLFRPNVGLPFRHGQKAAEADLLAAGGKIVVEVDGGYYHLEATQYRRDRRKDYLYQQHGYLVLRFLAEDVVDDLEAILTTILDAVALRRDGPHSEREQS